MKKNIIGEGRQTKKTGARKINSCFKECPHLMRSEFETHWLSLPDSIRKKLSAKELSWMINALEKKELREELTTGRRIEDVKLKAVQYFHARLAAMGMPSALGRLVIAGAAIRKKLEMKKKSR